MSKTASMGVTTFVDSRRSLSTSALDRTRHNASLRPAGSSMTAAAANKKAQSIASIACGLEYARESKSYRNMPDVVVRSCHQVGEVVASRVRGVHDADSSNFGGMAAGRTGDTVHTSRRELSSLSSSRGGDHRMASAGRRERRQPREEPYASKRHVAPHNPDFAHIGSWDQYSCADHNGLFMDLESLSEGKSTLSGYPPKAPCPPRLLTPELAPMSADYAFCVCTNNGEVEVGSHYCMLPKRKMDAQLAWATAYMEERKPGRGPRLMYAP